MTIPTLLLTASVLYGAIKYGGIKSPSLTFWVKKVEAAKGETTGVRYDCVNVCCLILGVDFS